MRKSKEIQKLIDRVVLNEQVSLVKQNLPEEELKKNKAYLENTILYEAIKDAFESDTEYKPILEAQVERNKAILEEELDPTLEVKEDNILMLRALKLMHTNEIKKERTREYNELCNSIIQLDHLLYVNDVQNFIEEFCGGKVSEEDKIRDKNPKIYDAIRVMRKEGHKLILQNEITKRMVPYLNKLEMDLLNLGDSENYDLLCKKRVSKESRNLNDYKDIISELKTRYEPKDEKDTEFDKYIVQYSQELQGVNYGRNAVSYNGQTTAITIKRKSRFEKLRNGLKNIKNLFSRKTKKNIKPTTIEARKDKSGLTVKSKREGVSPKATVDNNMAIESANGQSSLGKDTETMQNEFE